MTLSAKSGLQIAHIIRDKNILLLIDTLKGWGKSAEAIAALLESQAKHEFRYS
ncbi:MAG: hypothetical protein HKM04_11180 [Legionellales bacterium]|nr:hypothetical protein [Legionellales bacterium]